MPAPKIRFMIYDFGLFVVVAVAVAVVPRNLFSVAVVVRRRQQFVVYHTRSPVSASTHVAPILRIHRFQSIPCAAHQNARHRTVFALIRRRRHSALGGFLLLLGQRSRKAATRAISTPARSDVCPTRSPICSVARSRTILWLISRSRPVRAAMIPARVSTP